MLTRLLQVGALGQLRQLPAVDHGRLQGRRHRRSHAVPRHHARHRAARMGNERQRDRLLVSRSFRACVALNFVFSLVAFFVLLVVPVPTSACRELLCQNLFFQLFIYLCIIRCTVRPVHTNIQDRQELFRHAMGAERGLVPGGAWDQHVQHRDQLLLGRSGATSWCRRATLDPARSGT